MRVRDAAVSLAFALTMACTALVSGGDDGTLECAVVDEVDPCPGDLQCVGGVCQDPMACRPMGVEICGNLVDDDCDGGVDEFTPETNEACDGADNDCDGNVDEGFDNDLDGWSACNFENPALVDCVDTNPDIHPFDEAEGGPLEECDGADNDCDFAVDEALDDGTRLCERGQGCFPDRGGCVFIDCRLPEVVCPPRHACDGSTEPAVCRLVMEDCTMDGCPTAGQRCDPLRLMCIDPLPLGAACDRDVQCASNHCFSTAALELSDSDTSGATNVCSLPCCSDADCPADAVCWAPGTGARACVLRSLLGMGSEGVPAAQACANDSQCTGDICGLVETSGYRDPEIFMTACRGSAGSGGRYQGCSRGGQCESGMCIETRFGGVCTTACGSADDCGDTVGATPACTYRYASGTSDADWVQVCDLTLFRSDDGEGCDNNRDCIDSACIDGRCARTCCRSDQCGTDRTCQPVSLNGRWEMHCVAPE
ncbi:MAG TPA: MopE-related protein [Sandaracinaceae bacterium LLY-WYZ-13_1]|nr:MopE-related protein [Sandaracinaceae bacterium LLY-WYZ-13_1]